MTNNLTPWIVLGLTVVVSLYWKGYLKLPSPTAAQPPAPPVATQANAPGRIDPAPMTLNELALLLAHAARREAEQEVAGQIAKEAAEKVKAAFSAPFAAADAPAPAEKKSGE